MAKVKCPHCGTVFELNRRNSYFYDDGDVDFTCAFCARSYIRRAEDCVINDKTNEGEVKEHSQV